MNSLSTIVRARVAKQSKLAKLRADFRDKKIVLEDEIKALERLEKIGSKGIQPEVVKIAEKVLDVRGEPFIKTDGGGRSILLEAIDDIGTGVQKLRHAFFGNKRYEGFYQRCDCYYGMGPRHGHIVDYIGLRDGFRVNVPLTPEQTDACIYYLNNYRVIKEIEK